MVLVSLRGVSADSVRKLRAQLTLALPPAAPGHFDASGTLLLLDKTIKTESVWEISGTSAISVHAFRSMRVIK